MDQNHDFYDIEVGFALQQNLIDTPRLSLEPGDKTVRMCQFYSSTQREQPDLRGVPNTFQIKKKEKEKKDKTFYRRSTSILIGMKMTVQDESYLC